MANKFTGRMKNEAADKADDTELDQNNSRHGDEATEAAGETKEVKSIVPSKYASKYKDPANDDALRTFIKEQCGGEGGKIDLAKFYALLRANGVAEEHIVKFEVITTGLPEGQKPAGGVAGRAVMTLRNRLTPLARKGDGIKGLDGKTYDVKLPPAPKTGAVAKAAEAKEAAVAASAEQAVEENAA